jgi:predicted ribonuclease YlaK
LEERVAAFETAVTALRDQIKRWDRTTRYVVLDTCVYLEHRDQFDALNLAGMLHALETPIHVLLPMVVLDELDAAKRLHDHRRGRAVVALAIIDKVVRSNGVLRERDQTALAVSGSVPVPGRVTLDVLGEPADHVRLHHPDAEIVDRAVAVQAIAGVPVTLVTFDTTIAFRAREAGLIDVKLDEADRVHGQQKTKKSNAPMAP